MSHKSNIAANLEKQHMPSSSSLALLTATVAGAMDDAAQWRDCSAAGASLSGLSVDLRAPTAGSAEFSLAIAGTLDAPLAGGALNIFVGLLGIKVLDRRYDLCALSAKAGGTPCPLAAGPFNLTIAELMPIAAPAGRYTGRASITAAALDAAPVACVALDFERSAASASSSSGMLRGGLLRGAARNTDAGLDFLFARWAAQFKAAAADGTLPLSVTEAAVRRKVFEQNHDIILAHNARQLPYRLGHNQFSDLTLHEFKQIYLSRPMPPIRAAADGVREVDYGVGTAAAAAAAALPGAVDWAAAGAVTPVKNQGTCGSCWSFSTTGALEGAFQIKTGRLQSFSEQQLVSCAGASGNSGCNGGLMDSAFGWIKQQDGLCAEADYPYASGGGSAPSCDDRGCAKVAGSAVAAFTDVGATDGAMMSALAQQPVSIAIEADQSAFQLFASGVLTAACGTSLDHGVLAVGYGTLDGQDYYRVKNSWGPTWGDGGFINLARGGSSQKKGGQCGMLLSASYPSL
jgi:hypothetical protein